MLDGTGEALQDKVIDYPPSPAEQSLDAIRRALTSPDELYDLPIVATHVRIRCKYLVLTPSVLQVVSLRIGTVVRRFAMSTVDTKIFPFPFIIERGTDVTFTPSAGTVEGYLVGQPQSELDEENDRWR